MYDEPTAGLDPIASTVVEDLIRSLHMTLDVGSGGKKLGKIAAYVVVTHQHSTIRRAVDRYARHERMPVESVLLHELWAAVASMKQQHQVMYRKRKESCKAYCKVTRNVEVSRIALLHLPHSYHSSF